MFNLGERIREQLIDLAVETIKFIINDLAQGFFDMAYNFLELFLFNPTNFDDYPYMGELYSYIFILSVSLGGMFLCFNLLRYYFQDIGGYANRGPAEIIVKSLSGSAMALVAPWIVKEVFLRTNNMWVRFIMDLGVDTSTLEKMMLIPGGATLVIYLMTFGMAILFVILAIQLIIRIAEIAIQILLSPIAAISMQNEEINIWPIWWRETIATVYQQAYQITLLSFILNLIAGGDDESSYLLAFGLMIALLKGPAWLRKILYSTGSGRAAASAAGSAGKMSMYRFAATKMIK